MNKDLASIGDVYGKMLNTFKYHNINESNKNAFGDQPELVGKGPEVDGYFPALNDEKKATGSTKKKVKAKKVADEDEEFGAEDEESGNKREKTTESMRAKLKDPKLSDEQKKKIRKQIDLRTAEEAEETICTENKKIAKKTLNSFMSKSVFDKLYNKVLKENFGQDDTDALGLGDATPDSGLDDFGGDEDFGDEGEGDEDSVSFTLPRDLAQQLVDVLQGVLGGGEEEAVEDEGDLDFGGEDEGDEGGEFSFEEDEETQGTKVAPDKKAVFQQKGNIVKSSVKPKGGKAITDVTDETGTKDGAPPITALQGKSNQVPSKVKVGDFFKA